MSADGQLTASIDDTRVSVARQALAELPEADDNDRPFYWIGRLRMHLATLTAAWPSGVPGGLDDGQREVLGQALSDAVAYRTREGFCADCEAHPASLCSDCAADLDLTDAYLVLGRETGTEVPQ